MDGHPRGLAKRFPDGELEIARFAQTNPAYRSICEEMEMAEGALAQWAEFPARASEYCEILHRLVKELLGHLSDNARGNASAKPGSSSGQSR